jgi:hypothetical protein
MNAEAPEGWQKIDAIVERTSTEGVQEALEEAEAAKKPKRHWVMDYFRGNEKDGYVCVPPWLNEQKAPKLQPGPIARIDRNYTVTVKRLTDNIKNNLSQYEKHLGKKVGAYACVATDGHRALLVRDALKDGKHRKKWPVNGIPKPTDPNFVISDPEIINGLRRLGTVTKGEKYPSWVTFSLSAEEGRLVLSSSVPDIKGTEVYECQSTASIEFSVNTEFMIAACGSWPLICYFKDNVSPLIFMPKTKAREFMYVVMPVQK